MSATALRAPGEPRRVEPYRKLWERRLDKQPAVRLERDLPDAPEVVWASLTERERILAWFPCDVIVEGGEWRVGAAARDAAS